MTNPTDPAFPVYEGVAIDAQSYAKSQGGLTKLELFAALAMQGFCANPEFSNAGSAVINELSIERSNALIAALAKEQVRT